ncbi:MAG: tetratricopeptide repeat protein, partial [Gemmataceae bacterium]|nr:tetratricopeptide repeat protein [Gemmataceae bacterium]MDW8264226.1 tetratricopeptide repeat protein [Gemmataceae bacterium]
ELPAESASVAEGEQLALESTDGRPLPPSVAFLTSESASAALAKAPPLALLVVGIVLATVVAYSTSFQGAFVFDDDRWIVENPRIRSWAAALAVAQETRRPVVVWSLALNYALGGLDPWGYHAFNLAVHVLAALTLFGLVRRTCRRIGYPAPGDPSADWLGWAVAVLWAVHPLQTQSVTYIIQRSESLAGLFYLLTLYAAVRGLEASRGMAWNIAAAVAFALGLGSKETTITAPVVLLLLDRFFWADSWWEVVRRRWALYLALTILASGLLAAWWTGLGSDRATGGRIPGLSPADYLLTQAGVVLHYLRLAFWPRPLCFDYFDWPIARSVEDAWLSLLLTGGLLTATGLLLRFRPRLGFLPTAFFILLAPTCSVVPIVDRVAEHRMYLPLAPLMALGVLAVDAPLRWLQGRLSLPLQALVGGTLLAAVVVMFGWQTVRRNGDYRSAVSLWSDTAAKRPGNPRAWYLLGNAHLRERRYDLAQSCYERVFRLPDGFGVGVYQVKALYHQGVLLLQQGHKQAAAKCFVEVALKDPEDGWMAWNNLGFFFWTVGDFERAAECFAEVMARRPERVAARFQRALALEDGGRRREARAELDEALALDPEWPAQADEAARRRLAAEPLSRHQAEEALFLARQACLATGERNPEYLATLASAYAALEQYPEAVAAARQALEQAQALKRQELAAAVARRLLEYEVKAGLR